jgi:hypothetical protein
MLVLSNHKNNKGGLLRVLDLDVLSFTPKRMFWVEGVPKLEKRGGHGHYKEKQQLICVKGKILVNLYSNSGTEEYVLEAGDSCFMDNLVWAEQTYLTGDDILLVICSELHNEEDYFYDKGQIYE